MAWLPRICSFSSYFSLSLLEERLADFVAVQLAEVNAFGFRIEAELLQQLGLQSIHIPLVRMHRLGRVLFHLCAEDVRNVVFENQFFLIDAVEQLVTRAVDRLALLVHHVVILEQVLTRFEVLRFNCFLRGLDAAADHLRLDGDAFFHAQALQQGRDPLLGEDAHQVVFERQIETGSAGITLAACTSAKLIVDTPGFVALGAHDVQATRGDVLRRARFSAAAACTERMS